MLADMPSLVQVQLRDRPGLVHRLAFGGEVVSGEDGGDSKPAIGDQLKVGEFTLPEPRLRQFNLKESALE
jgi:hypothetical protein